MGKDLEISTYWQESVIPKETVQELTGTRMDSNYYYLNEAGNMPKAVVKLVLADEGMIGVATSERLRVISAGQVMLGGVLSTPPITIPVLVAEQASSPCTWTTIS
mgnify:CR=1 FL=1